MPTRSGDRKAHQIDLVVRVAEERLGPADSADVAEFIRQFFANVAEDELLAREPDALYGAALTLWKFAADRPPGVPQIRVYNPDPESHGWRSSHTVIEIVNDDMPFLVDSTTAALTGMGREIFLIIHPIITVERDSDGRLRRLLPADNGAGPDSDSHESGDLRTMRESVMHIEVDEQTDPESLAAIKERLEKVLADVRAAVEDWRPMRDVLFETIAELEDTPPDIEQDELEETLTFLKWLAEDHFTFLGYRHYDYQGDVGHQSMEVVKGSGLGILRDPEMHVLRTQRGLGAVSAEVRHFLQSPHPLIITKANVRATVHRPVHMDYIGVKTFDDDGNVTGERRFVGLFTSYFYTRSPREIPLLRRKVRRTMERAGFSATSHDGKALLNVLETYPRDELFQIDDDRLIDTSLGILRLEERPQVKVFLRPDKFERFVSALVYVPREIYGTALRRKIESVLAEAYDGTISTHYTQVGDAPLARVHIIVRTTPGAVPDVDPAEVDRWVREVARTWEDRLRGALIDQVGEERGIALWHYYGHAFSAAYREAFTPDHAVSDVEVFETLRDDGPFSFHVYRLLEDPDDEIRIKFYRVDRLVPLSDCLPMLEHLGLTVMEEQAYELSFEDGRQAWILDFTCRDPNRAVFDLSDIKDRLETVLWATCSGRVENDPFNTLVLKAGLTWRDASLFRALSKYLRQTEIPFSQEYMQTTLAANPEIVKCLARLFRVRFDPAFDGDRESESERLFTAVEEALENVASLDQDRIIRRFLNVIASILRTNYYQYGEDGEYRPTLAFKIDSAALESLPEPRPWVEIFVYSPRVEGVHLRGGKVARGGIRWSDRREDFRTEVLGLMKAQTVKNAVIVPVGAKGGFVPKKLDPTASRDDIYAEGLESYKVFIGGLLDITDNMREGAAVPPADVVRRDDDDPYLVVAADKGTATFSDTANDIAKSREFWLGDAFASGGSAGYDHKKMGITARGAWVSVQRHFREMGRDIQSEPFTMIGIGDMSGDVFGNGALLSPCTRLIAAFDHRHVFVDPNPDPETGFAERRRLFEKPRSTWADYDDSLISKGGGVFSRQDKSVPLSPEIQAMTGLDADRVTPNELIRALLTAEADLLWIGGIGTFVKAADESHAEVGDRTNDAIRVDGEDLQVRVVGEGGNLGFTQRGRIAFAAKDGRINTDAVDNSGGVDCSDHEVNIKILLNGLVADGDMTEKQRDRLLADMTEDVAEIVLEDNEQQTQAISVIEAQGDTLLEYQKRLMRALEKDGRLKRDIEYLPSDEALTERAAENRGLTRPEIAVLLAYAKMALFDAILASDIPEEDALAPDLMAAFPPRLRDEYPEAVRRHPLRREIIATELANEIVNYAGPTFLLRVQEESGFGEIDAVRAYVVAREIFRLRPLWHRIEALGAHVPATIQYLMLLETVEVLRRNVEWLLAYAPGEMDITALIAEFGDGVAKLMEGPKTVLADFELSAFDEKHAMYGEQGVPDDVATDIAALEPLGAALDIVRVANEQSLAVDAVGQAYFRMGSILGLDWLRSAAEDIPAADYWDRLAINALIDDLFVQQRQLTGLALEEADGKAPADAVAAWIRSRKAAVERNHQLMAELRSAGAMNVAKLGYAARYIRQLLPR